MNTRVTVAADITVPTPKAETRHITRYFRSLDPAVIAEGREWYPKARALAEDLAQTYEYVDYAPDGGLYCKDGAVERAAAVIAVLSPRLNWTKNVELARRAYDAAHYIANDSVLYGREFAVARAVAAWPGLKGNARKAFRILDGEDPNEVVQGPKVRSFWFTIMDPTDPRAVVVDRHTLDVACGTVLTDLDRGKLLSTPGKYDTVSELYRRAARILSKELTLEACRNWTRGPVPKVTITPAEVQAITWTAWRREHAARAASNRKAEAYVSDYADNLQQVDIDGDAVTEGK